MLGWDEWATLIVAIAGRVTPVVLAVAFAMVLCAYAALKPREAARNRIAMALLTFISGAVVWAMMK